MKYHKQEHLWLPDNTSKGSCYPTVIACLLDLELHDVPYFHLLYWTNDELERIFKWAKNHYLEDKEEKDCEEYQVTNYHNFRSTTNDLWNTVLECWLLSKGYEEDYIVKIDQFLQENPGRPYMASGMSSRTSHVVIYKDGKLEHDPHPSNEGLVQVSTFKYLRKLEGDHERARYWGIQPD